MQATKIAATTRKENGKGASRRLRAEGKLPAITYGPGKDPIALEVSPDEVAAVLTSDKGTNTLVDLEIDGKVIQAMIGEYQYHPLTRKLLHADFLQVTADQKIDTTVPLRLTGKSKGIVMGGKLRQIFRDLPIRSAAATIPAEVVYDITELGLDQAVHAGDLSLPEGVEVVLDAKRTVAVVAIDKRAKAAEEELQQKKPGEK